VQVPDVAVLVARQCLESSDEDSEIRDGELELPADFFEENQPKAVADLSKRVLQLSQRIRWCAIIPLGAPFVLWHLREYLDLVEQQGCIPPLHRTTIAAAWLSPIWFLMYFAPIIFFS
jgi:hypothetical protein